LMALRCADINRRVGDVKGRFRRSITRRRRSLEALSRKADFSKVGLA
jgi:hypothetical protein